MDIVNTLRRIAMTYREFRIRSDLSPARFRNDIGGRPNGRRRSQAKCKRRRGILRKAASDNPGLSRESVTLFSMVYKWPDENKGHRRPVVLFPSSVAGIFNSFEIRP